MLLFLFQNVVALINQEKLFALANQDIEILIHMELIDLVYVYKNYRHHSFYPKFLIKLYFFNYLFIFTL